MAQTQAHLGGGATTGSAPVRQHASDPLISGRRPLLAYIWAGPLTLLGLVAGAIVVKTGGTAEARDGVVEFRGGFAHWLLQRRLLSASAMTLGHVILGRDDASVDRCRGHEHGHVQQMERWGVLFVPAYLASSAWAVARGRHYYRDNWFERDADRRCAVVTPPQSEKAS